MMSNADSDYTIVYSSYRPPRAVCPTPEAMSRAMADKRADPSLEFSVVERVVPTGQVVGSYIWKNGAWC